MHQAGSSSAARIGRTRGSSLLVLAIACLAAPLAAQPPAQDKEPTQAVDPATDPSFDAALPPLESLQPPPATEPGPAPLAPAATTPPQPTTEQPAALPPLTPDSELAQPLQPLATFNPNPNTANAKAPTTATTRIRYTVKVEGLDKVGLTDEFRDHSALVKDGKKAANTAQVTARAEEDVQLAERILRSEGYYDGVASYTVAPVPGEKGLYVATISVTPGPRYDLGKIAIVGSPPEPTHLAREALPLKTGEPIRAIEVEGGEAQVSLKLPEEGYPFAKVGDRDILLDSGTHTGDYTLPLTAGPKSSFGGLRTQGDKVFGLKHLEVFPRFKPGQLYDSRMADDLRQALVATSLFSTVAVEPVDTGRQAPDGAEIVDLMVTQQKGPWHSLSGSLGYGTGEGIKATGTWTDRNMFPPEGALSGTIIAGTRQQGASGSFRRSNAGRRDKTFQVSLSANRSDLDAYNANTLDLLVNWSRQSTPIWQKTWTYSYGVEIVGTNEKGAALTPTGARPRRNYLIGALPVQVEYDRSNDLLNPTRGFRLLARVSPEASLHGSVHPYVRATGQATVYFPVSHSFVLAGRALVSSIVGVSSVEEIAPSRRVYSGGGGSVRGYGYQDIGPKDAQHHPIGGLTSTEFAIEGRYRFGNFGIVPFVDAGRVGESSTPGLSHLRYGAGIGARYYTNFGPLRLDIATPLNRQPGDSRIAVYISIGQAF